jgi:hypothetical protein
MWHLPVVLMTKVEKRWRRRGWIVGGRWITHAEGEWGKKWVGCADVERLARRS